jgi:putative endonuclease
MSRVIGAAFERLAAEYLQARGLVLIETNFTCRAGEIDLVCDDRGTLVFVEVRARKNARHGEPIETVSAAKRRRLIKAAQLYLLRRNVGERACRFDVVAIEGEGPGARVTHYVDAFDATS